jgi:hypothetical protein
LRTVLPSEKQTSNWPLPKSLSLGTPHLLNNHPFLFRVVQLSLTSKDCSQALVGGNISGVLFNGFPKIGESLI